MPSVAHQPPLAPAPEEWPPAAPASNDVNEVDGAEGVDVPEAQSAVEAVVVSVNIGVPCVRTFRYWQLWQKSSISIKPPCE